MQMRTVEQLEKNLPPENAKADMSNELLATLGINPIKGKASSKTFCTTFYKIISLRFPD